ALSSAGLPASSRTANTHVSPRPANGSPSRHPPAPPARCASAAGAARRANARDRRPASGPNVGRGIMASTDAGYGRPPAARGGRPVANQGSLAVDFFLVVHDPFDGGQLTVSPEVLGCGLAGGKLADLVLDRRLRVDDDRLVALDGPAPADEIDDYVVRAVR